MEKVVCALRVGMLGPGGVGGLIAALLAREGAEVTCIASPTSAATIATRGLSVTSSRFGSFHAKVDAQSALVAPLDVLCIAVKATDLEDALTRVPVDVTGDAIVVPFLNGIEHVALLRERLGKARVVAATIRVESTRVATGEILHVSPFTVVEIAPPASEIAAIAGLVDLLSSAGVDVTVRDNEYTILWEKLAFLAPFALLTTVYDVAAGAVRTTHRAELNNAVDEVAQVALADDVRIDIAKVHALFDAIPKTMQSSMQRDAQAGRPLEIEAIGGAVVRAANAHSIDVTTIARLVTELHGRAQESRL